MVFEPEDLGVGVARRSAGDDGGAVDLHHHVAGVAGDDGVARWKTIGCSRIGEIRQEGGKQLLVPLVGHYVCTALKGWVLPVNWHGMIVGRGRGSGVSSSQCGTCCMEVVVGGGMT